jgi:uncharacterized protein (DUF1810 family)
MNDPVDLNRFIDAQENTYDTALAEVRSGQKRSHWMWYIFPQLRGLGTSPTARKYGISGLAEAKAFLEHPVLGPRLIEISHTALRNVTRTANEVFGTPDDMKLRSCATLFAQISDNDSVFHKLIERLFHDQLDERTLKLLQENNDV